ncbi:uncharacterized protein LOC135475688 [Liolophura sinensis]|uniref:uncharacterized protein LOC135475688 n=1 Tax=Liolophura sinensis TaxID=3198878 RepID=UPI00315811BA
MDFGYHERPFYSWRVDSPDTVAELEAVMQQLNQTPRHRKQTVALGIISDHAIRSRERFHLGRFLMLFILPVVAMLILCICFVTDKSSELMTKQQVRALVVDIETLIDNVRRERAAMTLHQTEQTEESEAGLREASLLVDRHIMTKSHWLQELQPYVRSFRRVFEDTTLSITDQLSAYSSIINKMSAVWVRAYPEKNEIKFWKSLVRYLLQLILNFHCVIEKDALKSFSQMNEEPSPLDSVLFHSAVNMLVDNWFSTITQNASPQNSIKVEDLTFRKAGALIAYNMTTRLSWPDVVERFVILQQNTTQRAKEDMLETITQQEYGDRTVVTGYIILIFLSLSFLPFLGCSIRNILLSYNRFIKALNTRIQEVKAEEKRAKSVMCQLMPPSIVSSLSQRAEVNTEFFSSATIMFADIHGISSLISKCSPSDVITTMNCLFTLLDKRIEKYDTYRMDIVGESYMISSGVPRRNGNKHVTEIANLALDLVNVFSDLEIIYSPESRVSFKLGIHTANKIQISAVSKALLAVEDYFIQPRGLIEIKGKRKMLTYWLIGRDIEDHNSELDIDELHKSRRRESFSAWSNVWDSRPNSQRTGSRISVKFTTPRVSVDERRISTFSRFNARISEKIPTIEDIEFLHANKAGSPLILQLTEGIHY